MGISLEYEDTRNAPSLCYNRQHVRFVCFIKVMRLHSQMQGDPADRRMTQHAAKRGVKLTSISRPVVRSDFETFDLILAMDESNQSKPSARSNQLKKLNNCLRASLLQDIAILCLGTKC
jgi:hypothetical protein